MTCLKTVAIGIGKLSRHILSRHGHVARHSLLKFPLQLLHGEFSPLAFARTSCPAGNSGNSGIILMGIIGLIAVVAIASVITPHLAGDIDQEVKEAEDKHLQAIARGIKAYIRHNQRFPPILDSLRPEYVPYYSSMSLAQNERGHSRYFVIHPNMRGFNNKSGLSASEVADARFLLISHLNHDGAPAIATAAQFETWWMTDERSTPSVTIYRGNVGHFFHQRSSTGEGDGGSDDINETTKKSEGTRASTHDRYHLASTNPGFDEDDAHSPSAP